MKIVINNCHGGFGLSKQALDMYCEKKQIDLGDWDDEYEFYDQLHTYDIRNDPVLIEVVEELGKRANGCCASLKIVEIPDDVKWEIEEYDGNEWIAEKHRKWY